jgi:hypothetical protein
MAELKKVVTVKTHALAMLIAKLIRAEFGDTEINVESGLHIGYRVLVGYEDDNIDHITWFAVGIRAAVGNLFE